MSKLPIKQKGHPAYNMPEPTQSFHATQIPPSEMNMNYSED